MFKTYEKYIIKNFLNKFLTVSLIFFGLIIILSILEEISFFKNISSNFLFPYFLTVLGAPITLFEIFPFIFLIIFPKNNIRYKKNRKITFLITFLIIVLSEASLRYSTTSNLTTSIYLILPWVSFIIVYLIFYSRAKYV